MEPPSVIVWTGTRAEFEDWQHQARRYDTPTGFRGGISVRNICTPRSAEQLLGWGPDPVRLVRYGTWQRDSGTVAEIVSRLAGFGVALAGRIDRGLDLIPPPLSVEEIAVGLMTIAAQTFSSSCRA